MIGSVIVALLSSLPAFDGYYDNPYNHNYDGDDYDDDQESDGYDDSES